LVCLRAVTGVALAWVYPPGMKIAAGWVKERRGAALGFVIGALTVGSAFPHLLAALSTRVPWRTLMLAASALALTGGVVVATLVKDGPYSATSARFDPLAAVRVFAVRGTRLATLGYLGHMWELYAVWTWIAAFASASFLGVTRTSAPLSSPEGSGIAFVLIASGAIGSALTGLFADTLGKARVATWALLTSGVCCTIAGLLFQASPVLLFAFAVVWGVAVVADSAQLSALVAEHTPPEHVGTALTIQLCGGFLLTMVSIRLVPVVAQAIGWQWVFLCLVPGPFAGAWALRELAVPPATVRPST